MTEQEIQQQIINHWLTYFRRQALKLGHQLQDQALAAAKLTRREMDSLTQIGLSEQEAWIEARNLHALKAPPSLAG